MGRLKNQLKLLQGKKEFLSISYLTSMRTLQFKSTVDNKIAADTDVCGNAIQWHDSYIEKEGP